MLAPGGHELDAVLTVLDLRFEPGRIWIRRLDRVEHGVGKLLERHVHVVLVIVALVLGRHPELGRAQLTAGAGSAAGAGDWEAADGPAGRREDETLAAAAASCWRGLGTTVQSGRS